MSYSPSRMNVSENPEAASEEECGYMGQAYHAAERCVKDYPTSSVMVAFGAAFGLGFLLSQLIPGREEPQRSRMAQFGQRTLDALSRVMPESVAQRIHS